MGNKTTWLSVFRGSSLTPKICCWFQGCVALALAHLAAGLLAATHLAAGLLAAAHLAAGLAVAAALHQVVSLLVEVVVVLDLLLLRAGLPSLPVVVVELPQKGAQMSTDPGGA